MKFIEKIKNVSFNIFTFIMNIFLKRDESIILIGAWMGTKFADNSRFLFQYLHENSELYHLRKVIWVTRCKDVHQMLNSLGYECYLIGEFQSFYYHIKAGVHIICNAATPVLNFKPDIDSKYSLGAKKIQLWHGNGIKGVGLASNEYYRQCSQHQILTFVKNILKNIKFIEMLSTPGGWTKDNYFILTKSEIDKELFKKKFNIDEDRCIDAGYPRNCKCIKYLDKEIEVINQISEYDKIILYLPTFRSNYENYIHPLENEQLISYIRENNILWIEKLHTASTGFTINSDRYNNVRNILFLDSKFDINILNPLISLLITDYSSVMFDAIYFKKPIVYYTPDYDYYIKDDRGMIVDYDSILVGEQVFNIEKLKDAICLVLSDNPVINKNYDNIRNIFWENDNFDYDDIWNALIQAKD